MSSWKRRTPSTPSGSRALASRRPSASSAYTSWWASAQSWPTNTFPIATSWSSSVLEPEATSTFLMVQCSRHVIPPVVEVDLADQQAHGLGRKLGAQFCRVLTCWRLGHILLNRILQAVDPH